MMLETDSQFLIRITCTNDPWEKLEENEKRNWKIDFKGLANAVLEIKNELRHKQLKKRGLPGAQTNTVLLE